MNVRHRAEIELAIEMREQVVVARAFPPQRIAERIRIDRDQEQADLPEEMLSCGFRDLPGGREMNEAIAQVVGAAVEHTLPLGFAPGRGRTDLVDRAHEVSSPSAAPYRRGLPFNMKP